VSEDDRMKNKGKKRETKFRPRCEDKKCKGYGKPLVDRGHGYPVCPTSPRIEDNPAYPEVTRKGQKADIRKALQLKRDME